MKLFKILRNNLYYIIHNTDNNCINLFKKNYKNFSNSIKINNIPNLKEFLKTQQKENILESLEESNLIIFYSIKKKKLQMKKIN